MSLQCNSIQEKIDIKKDNLVFIRIQYIKENIDFEVMARIVWNIFDTIGVQFNEVSQETNKIIDEFLLITKKL